WAAAGGIVAAAAAVTALVLPDYLTADGSAKAGPTPVVQPAPAQPAPVPAAAPPPAPTPPPQPSDVMIGFQSTPAGAGVFRAGETVALGTTPSTTTLPRSDKPFHVRFELAGYRPYELDVATTDAGVASAILVAAPVAQRPTVRPGPPTTTARPRVQREG